VFFRVYLRRAAYGLGGLVAASALGAYTLQRSFASSASAGHASAEASERMRVESKVIRNKDIPSREEMIQRLKKSTTKPQGTTKAATNNTADNATNEQDEDVYDILVIGGGATGTGVALDAISRGLKVALVERDDFASGTSSRSTKLIHGGVRYLEKVSTSDSHIRGRIILGVVIQSLWQCCH